MKKIVKYKALGLLLLTMLFATSCNDFINKLPENKVPSESIDYANTGDAYKVVLGAMHTTENWQSGWSVNGVNQVRGDEVEKGNPSPTDQSQFTEFSNLDYTNAANFWAVGGAWGAGFYPIMDANSALLALDKYAELAKTQAEKDLIAEYKLEVRFWRAWSYYFVSRIFGAVPLFEDNNSADAFVKKPYTDVMKYVITECDDIYAGLPKVHPKDMPGRIGVPSAYSALGLKAKAAAEILDYDAMLSATDLIIESGKFDLMTDFYKVFRVGGRLSPENVFEMQYTNGDGTNAFWADAYYAWQGPAQSIESAKKFGANQDNLAGGWGFMVPTAKFKAFMKARGENVRLETTIWEVGQTTRDGDYLVPDATKPYPSMYNGKAYTPSIELADNCPWYGYGTNIIQIRFSDILLLNAEAKVAKGGDVATPFNRVRTRAGLGSIASPTIDDIMDERLAELAFECNRYYDLARTGKAATELTGWTPAKRFYPIPQSQLDLNPNLGLTVE